MKNYASLLSQAGFNVAPDTVITEERLLGILTEYKEAIDRDWPRNVSISFVNGNVIQDTYTREEVETALTGEQITAAVKNYVTGEVTTHVFKISDELIKAEGIKVSTVIAWFDYTRMIDALGLVFKYTNIIDGVRYEYTLTKKGTWVKHIVEP